MDQNSTRTLKTIKRLLVAPWIPWGTTTAVVWFMERIVLPSQAFRGVGTIVCLLGGVPLILIVLISWGLYRGAVGAEIKKAPARFKTFSTLALILLILLNLVYWAIFVLLLITGALFDL